MTSKRKISLLVPCFNAERYIISFLECIDKLNVKFGEVIFYDDCSTDNSVFILKENNQNVIVGEQNMGPAFARNILAKNAKFDWFHFHDIDDLLHPNYLQEVAKSDLLNNNQVILCNVDWLNSDQLETIIKWRYSNIDINLDPIRYTLTHPIGGINGLYKRDVFQKINGFDEALKNWEDADLHVMLALSGAKFHVIEKVLSFSIRRIHSQSSDQTEAWKYRLISLEKYYNIFSEKYLPVLGRESEKLLSVFTKSSQTIYLSRTLNLIANCGITTPNSNLSRKLSLILPKKLLWRLRILHLKLLVR